MAPKHEHTTRADAAARSPLLACLVVALALGAACATLPPNEATYPVDASSDCRMSARQASARLRSNILAAPPPDEPSRLAAPALPSKQAIGPASAPVAVVSLEMPLGAGSELELPPGKLRVAVEVPGENLVTLGLVGLRQALVHMAIDAPQAWLADDSHDDGELPRFVSLETPPGPTTIVLDLELSAPLVLVRRALGRTPPEVPRFRALRQGSADPRALIGLPFPAAPADGYFFAEPHRYQFARHDVALALRAALAQTRTRFRRDPLAVGDLSQWDGDRPASDVGNARHIGHEGGREVDIALPSSDASASEITNRCQPVMVDRDVTRCAPGTVKGFDALRLAYLLGLLIDGPTPEGRYMPENRPGPLAVVDSILTDEAYIDEIRRALPELQRRHWIHDEAFGALMEEGILRPSPWHVDHVHVRFAGEDGLPLVARARRTEAGSWRPLGPTWLPGIRP